MTPKLGQNLWKMKRQSKRNHNNYNKLSLTTCKHCSVSVLFVEVSTALLGTCSLALIQVFGEL